MRGSSCQNGYRRAFRVKIVLRVQFGKTLQEQLMKRISLPARSMGFFRQWLKKDAGNNCTRLTGERERKVQVSQICTSSAQSHGAFVASTYCSFLNMSLNLQLNCEPELNFHSKTYLMAASLINLTLLNIWSVGRTAHEQTSPKETSHLWLTRAQFCLLAPVAVWWQQRVNKTYLDYSSWTQLNESRSPFFTLFPASFDYLQFPI